MKMDGYQDLERREEFEFREENGREIKKEIKCNFDFNI